MGNLSEHFDLQEFIPRLIWNGYKEKSIWFINPKIVALAEFVRKYFDAPVIINNWHTGGQFNERGYRVPMSNVGAKFSQHKLGNAIDINVKGLAAGEVSKRIIKDYALFKVHGLTTIENPEATPTWTHLDVRWHGGEDLLIVNP